MPCAWSIERGEADVEDIKGSMMALRSRTTKFTLAKLNQAPLAPELNL